MTFFLTDIDPNAKTKGSRDPLGTLSVWTGFGRQVVGNLTTQNISFDDFRVLLIGCWLEDQVSDQTTFPGDAFLVWEQLAAYARLEVVGVPEFRGTNRARRYLAEGPRVSPERDDQLLNNQYANGIWGLYRAPAWRCGLISQELPMVRGRAQTLVEEHYLPILRAAWGDELESWVVSGHVLDVKKHRVRLEAVAACISGDLTDAEVELYRDTLAFGGSLPVDIARCQRELAEALAAIDPDVATGRDVIARIIGATTSVLADRLEDVLACEAVLAPAAMCFSYLSQQSQAPLTRVAEELADKYAEVDGLVSGSMLARLEEIWAQRPARLRTFPGEGDGPVPGDRWLRIARHLHAKEMEPLCRLLLQQNDLVSRDRGGNAGWVRVTTAGTLDVQQPDYSYNLRDPDEVQTMWENPYFLGVLRGVADRVVEVA